MHFIYVKSSLISAIGKDFLAFLGKGPTALWFGNFVYMQGKIGKISQKICFLFERVSRTICNHLFHYTWF